MKRKVISFFTVLLSLFVFLGSGAKSETRSANDILSTEQVATVDTHVEGYLSEPTNVRRTIGGEVIRTARAGEYINGTKLSNGYIKIFDDDIYDYAYIYDFGLLSGKDVEGYIGKAVYLRDGLNGPIYRTAPAGEYITGIKLSNGYIKLYVHGEDDYLYAYDFGLFSGESVEGYLSRATNLRDSKTNKIFKCEPAGTYVSGMKLSNGYIVIPFSTYETENDLLVYDFGLLSGKSVDGYIGKAVYLRDGLNGPIYRTAPAGEYIMGIKLSNGYIKLYEQGENDDLYAYDFGLFSGESVEGYLSRATNLRDSKTNKIFKCEPAGTYVSGMKLSNGYIVIPSYTYETENDLLVYDFGLLSGKYVDGYIGKAVYLRDGLNGPIYRTAPAGEYITGIKLSNGYIKLNEQGENDDLYAYDFGLFSGESVEGYLSRATNLRDSKTNKIFKCEPAGTYVSGMKLSNGYIVIPSFVYETQNDLLVYDFGLLSGSPIEGYFSRPTYIREGLNGNKVRTSLVGEYIAGIKLSNGYIKSRSYGIKDYYFAYDFGLFKGNPVSGYLEYSSNVRQSIGGKYLKNLKAGTYIEGEKLDNGYISLNKGDSYIYDFGLLKGTLVKGYVPSAVNVRNAPDGKIISSLQKYEYISGIKNNDWIGLYNGRYIYDFGLLKGRSVEGYASQNVNIRSTPTGKIVGSMQYGDLIEGEKIANYIHLKNGNYIYDFGLLPTRDVKGLLKRGTNVRYRVNGKIVDSYPAGTYVEGKKIGNWIALDNGFYIYDLGLDTTNNISTTTDVGVTFAVPSQKRVYDYYHNYQSGGKDKMNVLGLALQSNYAKSAYSVLPDVKNFNQGRLALSTQRDSLHVANTFRYSTGLEDVSLNSEFSRLAQAGSFINYLNGTLSHFPKVPKGLSSSSKVYKDGFEGSSSSNIAAGYGAILDIFGFMDDIGTPSLGHRAWILNPCATEFGVGGVGYMSQLKVSQENSRYVGPYVLPYPNRSTAIEWLGNSTPLSIFFSDDFDISNAKVTLTNVNTGKSRIYTTSSGLFFPEYYGYGHDKALIFGCIDNLNTWVKYRVKVTGVKKNNKAYPIEYTIDFFRMSK